MTWHHDRDRICTYRLSNGSSLIWLPDVASDLAVGRDVSVLDRQQPVVDLQLEVGRHPRKVELKLENGPPHGRIEASDRTPLDIYRYRAWESEQGGD